MNAQTTQSSPAVTMILQNSHWTFKKLLRISGTEIVVATFPPFVEVRRLEDGIVYFRLASFSSEQMVTDFERQFEQLGLAKVTGMILDVRSNMGGNSTHAFSVVSRLIEEPVETAKFSRGVLS